MKNHPRATTHAVERFTSRLSEVGVDPDAMLTLAEQIAAHYEKSSVAVRMLVLRRSCGDQSADLLSRESNGNEWWVICRDGWVVTLMLRRSEQPKTREALRVEQVLIVRDGKVARVEVK